MPELPLPPGMTLHCYEDLMDQADENFDWPDFDENTASALCYTSGTTGRPKGVLYSHRSAMLHAMAANAADAYGFRAVDRVFMATSMFHATAWAWPYCTAMTGAAQVMPGASSMARPLPKTLNEERITYSGGVPTIWLGVLDALKTSGAGLATLQRLMVGGSACPRVLVEGFGAHGVHVYQAWGMTETSPLVTHHGPLPATVALNAEAATRLRGNRAARSMARTSGSSMGTAMTCRMTAWPSAIC